MENQYCVRKLNEGFISSYTYHTPFYTETPECAAKFKLQTAQEIAHEIDGEIWYKPYCGAWMCLEKTC